MSMRQKQEKSFLPLLLLLMCVGSTGFALVTHTIYSFSFVHTHLQALHPAVYATLMFLSLAPKIVEWKIVFIVCSTALLNELRNCRC